MKVARLYFGGAYTTSTLKILHQKPDKTRTDYFSPGCVAGFIVIQDGSNVFTYLPSLDVWEKKPASEAVSPEALRPDLVKNFDIRLIGSAVVAGRSAYVILATPHNPDETARRLWIDEASYLVIGMQVEDPRGTIVNSSHYTSIELNPTDIGPDAFRITGKVRDVPKPARVEFESLVPKYLPSGYRLYVSTSITVNGASCAHMQFSNGSNVISLFERRGEDAIDRSPVPHKSNVTSVLTWSRDGIVFTLIGDVAHKELVKIADSMR